MKLYLLALTAVCVLFSSASMAASPQNLPELQQAIRDIQQETGVPSIGIALVGRDGPVWVSAIGYADVEAEKPATADTIYRLGSVSKLFTGVAVMRLVEQGQLSLEDRLVDVAPDLVFENAWEDTHPVRIVHLLEHTTGWDVHLGEYAGEASDSISLEESLSRHTDARVSRWVPGTRHAYSNTGPVVAARVVEKVTGMSFDEYVHQNVFTPLGMDSTGFLKTEAFDLRGAKGYTREGPTQYRYFFTRPSSSLNASPNDLANFLQMLIDRGDFAGETFLSEKTIHRMESAETTLGANAGMHAGYGLTNDVTGFGDWHMPFYGHSGGIPGGVSEVVYQPDLRAGFAFTMNAANGEAFGRVSHTLREYLLKDSQRREVTPQVLPDAFKNLRGLFVPVNPLSSVTKAITDINGVMRFETNDRFLHRSPFFGGWTSQDYLPEGVSENVLYSAWSGLPSIAIVHDPLIGEAVQVEGTLYKRVSPVLVYGRLVILALSLVLVVSSIIYSAFWLIKRSLSKRQEQSDDRVNLVAAGLSALLLVIPAFFLITNADPALVMESAPIGLFLFLVTLLYPFAVVGALYPFYKAKFKAVSRGVYWYSGTVIIAHVVIASYLASYGLLPFRIWA